jgi:hypothetical protein
VLAARKPERDEGDNPERRTRLIDVFEDGMVIGDPCQESGQR